MGCSSCVFQYIESRVNSGEVQSADLSCPIPGCRQPFPDEFISDLLEFSESGLAVLERLLDFKARRFVPQVGSGDRLVTCPSAGCGQVLVPEEFVTELKEVVCPSCSRSFCAGCCSPAHPGLTCETAEEQRMDPELQ